MTTPRDPHLPPPAVVDWLLEQNWSETIPVTNIQYEGARPQDMTRSKHWEYKMAWSILSEDGAGHILLPVETLDALRRDAAARKDQSFTARFFDTLLDSSLSLNP